MGHAARDEESVGREEPALAAARAHEFALRSGYREGERAWGPLQLAFERFAAGVLERLVRRLRNVCGAASDEQIGAGLERCATSDLYLTLACDDHRARAWEVLASWMTPRLTGLARRRGASPTEAEEIVAELPGDLAGPPPGASYRTRIGGFDGSGSLFAWLAVFVARRLADRARSNRAFPLDPQGSEPGGESTPIAEPSAGRTDPAADSAAEELSESLRSVLREAWTVLDDRERLALRFKYGDGLAQARIAGLLGLSESRTSRLLAGAVGRLRDLILRRFQAAEPERWSDEARLWSGLAGILAEFLQEAGATPDPLVAGDVTP